MAYTPTTWINRLVQYENRYVSTDNGDGTITLTASTGDVYAEGTDVIASYLNNMENKLVEVGDIEGITTSTSVTETGYTIDATIFKELYDIAINVDSFDSTTGTLVTSSSDYIA